MKIEEFGSGKKIFNIIVGVHGNEYAPIQGFLLLKKYLINKSIKKSFNVIIANEEAISKKKRFIGIDLNRCFPGSHKGSHEEKLADRLLAEASKVEFNFDFHSTTVKSEPYGIVSVYSKKIYKIMGSVGVSNYIFDASESLIKFAPNAIAFEVGQEGNKKSAINAFMIMKALLIHFGIIEDKNILKKYSPSIYLIYHFISRSKLTVLSKKIADFQYIHKGEIIGYGKNKKPMLASEGFYPVLVNDKRSIKKSKRIIIEE